MQITLGLISYVPWLNEDLHSTGILSERPDCLNQTVLCNLDSYREGKYLDPRISSTILVNSQTTEQGILFEHLDNLSETSPSAPLWVFGSNRMLIQIKAFVLTSSLLPSSCSPLTAQRLGGRTTDGFPGSLPLEISHNSDKWLCEVQQWSAPDVHETLPTLSPVYQDTWFDWQPVCNKSEGV